MSSSKSKTPLDPNKGPATMSLLRSRLDSIQRKNAQLVWQYSEKLSELERNQEKIKQLQSYLGISDQVTDALDTLSQQMFSETLDLLQEKLTIALQEVLDQPIEFRAEPAFKNKSAVVEFSIRRDGKEEDLVRGQGGSVHNILSVGLRIFALAQLDPDRHRRFLVLDEQDCWLRPDLVPRLVRMIQQAARELGFQIILISHHDVNLFRQYADKIYRMEPTTDGVEVSLVYEKEVDADP